MNTKALYSKSCQGDGTELMARERDASFVAEG